MPKKMYIYEDPRTGEIFHYSRKGRYTKNGRTLIFKGKAHILGRVEQCLKKKEDKN